MDKEKPTKSSIKVEVSPGQKRSTRLGEVITQISRTPLEDEPRKGGLDITGVACLSLSPETQTTIQFEAEKVNKESPWKYVPKVTIENDIILKGPNSDFHEIRERIKAFQGKHLFMGFNLASTEPNQYFICTTEEARKAVQLMISKQRLLSLRKLGKANVREARPWTSLGSENEIHSISTVNKRQFIVKEIVTTSDLLNREVKFQMQDAKDLPYGLVKFSGRSDIVNVTRRRYERGIQACPCTQSRASQTEQGLPKNMWTQYEYKVELPLQTSDEVSVQNLKRFLQGIGDSIESAIVYNEGIDLYKDEFPELVLDEKDTLLPETISYEEYTRFIDMQHCKSKVISSVAWHPTLSGIVAISYTPNTRYTAHRDWDIYENEPVDDNITNAVYDKNYVLVWCLANRFKPKLFLESPHEVHILKFCPFRENMLVGGLDTGQIVIWDITDKLQQVEREAFIKAQRKEHYQNSVKTHLRWMKGKRSLAYVKPIHISHPRYSHVDCITGVEWISPFWQITNTGYFEVLEHEMSHQFLTSGEDGFINVWDLRDEKQAMHGVSHLPFRTLSIAGASPEQVTRTTWIRSHFQLAAENQDVGGIEDEADHIVTHIPLSAINMGEIPLQLKENRHSKKYGTPDKENTDELNESAKKIMPKWMKFRIKRRQWFTRVPVKPEKDPVPEVLLGSVTASILKITWADEDSDTDKNLPTEVSSCIFWPNVHDGPIIYMTRSPFMHDLLLTVGGTVFAIWKESYKVEPVFYRRRNVHLTGACWSFYRPSVFSIADKEGKVEIWDLFVNSQKPIYTDNATGAMVTGVFFPPLPSTELSIMGIADSSGSFRVLYVPKQHSTSHQGDGERLQLMIAREISRKEALLDWRSKWEIKFADMLRKRKEERELEAKRKEEAVREMNRLMKEAKKRKEEELRAKLLRQSKKLEFTWKRDAENKWNAKEEKYLMDTLLKKKQLDEKELQKDQQPFVKLGKEEKDKYDRLQDRLAQKAVIFQSTVLPLIPKITEETDVCETEYKRWMTELQGKKHSYMEQFKALEIQTKEYIKQHPFKPYRKEDHSS